MGQHVLTLQPTGVHGTPAFLEKTIVRLKTAWVPRKVFLFSGHMIDAPDRPEPRFPPEKEPVAAQAIADKLATLDAGPEDLAICSGACGGDLLFAETCLQRGLGLQIYIPFEIPLFLEKSVTFAGAIWADRFYAAKNDPRSGLFTMPEELGTLPENANPYECCNLWQLYSALAYGPEKVHFICLWNGRGGDGPGGTKHMHDEVNKRSGHVYVLDTNTLW